MTKRNRSEYMRSYQREWMRKRRAEFFDGKMCARCGAHGPLELDHIDPSQKVSHRVWSWSEERRAAEIAKCQVLCATCHLDKTLAGRDYVGARNPAAVWTDDEVLYMHELRLDGLTYEAIGATMGASKSAIRHAYTRRMSLLEAAA